MQLLQQIPALEFPAELPTELLEVEQRFDVDRVDDVAGAARRVLDESGFAERVSGKRVAIGVGSRGVANLPVLVRAAVAWADAAGASPFIVPAMGSHGGATAEGQIETLASLGVDEIACGAPIVATMETREIGRLPDGPALYQGLDSLAADYTLLISRIKPHTDFRSTIESGPAKMAVIGLGKQRGALAMHEGGGANFQRYLAPAARVYEANTNLLGALCVVENAFDETAKIAVLGADEIGAEREANLLVEAKALLANLPFPEIDVLIVRELGKDISGTGMDTNVIGRLMIPRQPESFGNVDVAVIGVLDVSAASHGNATGMGLANLTTMRLAQKVDWAVMYTNGITSGIFGMFRNSLPMTLPSDRQLLEVAVRCCGCPPEKARIVLIRDTLHLGKIWVSPSLRVEVEAHPRLHLTDTRRFEFDVEGNMLSPWMMVESSLPIGDPH